MAYGNWGAFVYKDGERQRNWEDQTPYHEEEYPPGYYQACGRDRGFLPHHAVLGKDRVRLCGYKNFPVLFVDAVKVELETYRVTEDRQDHRYTGTIEGYAFTAEQFDGNMLDLHLFEPDGTHWTSRCGYGYGAGHLDLDET